MKLHFSKSLLITLAALGLGVSMDAGESAFRYDLRDAATAQRFKGSGTALTAEGLRIDGGKDVPRVNLSGANMDVTGKPWLVLTMSSTKGRYGGFTFAGAKEPQTFVFPIVADGKMHAYNVSLASETMSKAHVRPSYFKGAINSFGVILTYEPGAEGTLQGVQFSANPSGSPSLFIPEYAGAVECLNRVGRTAPVAVRFRNAGGKPMTGIKANFESAAPLKLASAWRGVPNTLAPDTMATIIADVLPQAIGSHPFTVKLTDAEGATAEATGTLLVDPALKDIPELSQLTPGVIPAPKPLKIPGYDLGLWYFPGWGHLNHWPAIPAFIERRPELGYYDESSPEAADWCIKWAVEHGVNFFNLLQYFQPGGVVANNPFLEKAFLKARFLKHIQFYETWSNDTLRGRPIPEQDFMKNMKYMVDLCFALPNYKKSPDGRPLLGILNGAELVSCVGNLQTLEKYKQQVEAYAKSKGHKGIFWIMGGGGSARFKSSGFEGFTYYNAPMAGSPHPCAPARILVANQHQFWNGITAPGSLTMLPITTGFDHRPWWGKTSKHVWYEMTPALFAQALADGKRYVDSIGQKTLLIECWNEWGEGSCLGPQAEHGFEFLKAIPRVLAPNEPPRPIVVPRDIGMTFPELPGLWNEARKPAIANP